MLTNYPQLRYCKVRHGTKKPSEKDWTNKPYKLEEIQDHIKKETNFGVLCGHGDLAVIDSDTPELQKCVERNFPETFTVETGSGGIHSYFFVEGLKQKIILTTTVGGVDKHWGEVQSYGTQVVGPGSIHPNGKTYQIKKDVEIVTLPIEELLASLQDFRKEPLQSKRAAAWEKETYEKKYGSEIDLLNVGDIWGTVGLKAHGSEYYGEHPTHGSETGQNFWLNPSRNLWHCFRCNSGGGPLSAIAVKEGIIDCSEAQKGLLRGTQALDAIKVAKESYGLIQENQSLDPSKDSKKDYELIWESDMDSYEIEDKRWVIDKLIPSKSVGIWTGKRGTFKTFLVLSAVFAVAGGKQFLGKYDTKPGKVIYLDKENGLEVMKQRKNMIKKGLEIDKPTDVGFICFSNLKIDKAKDIAEIESLIKKHEPTLLAVDTYRRGISFEENDAGKVSWLFVDVLRPIVEKYNTSIILIHHDKKGETTDEMDAIRGSSDLANYADFILKNERRGVNLILKQLKLRNAPEIQPINIKMETDETTNITFTSTGNYELQTKDQKCAEILTLWIITKGVEQFKTRDAQEVAFKEGIKKNNFHNGLQLLIDNGLIEKGGHGDYKVISDNSKLIV